MPHPKTRHPKHSGVFFYAKNPLPALRTPPRKIKFSPLSYTTAACSIALSLPCATPLVPIALSLSCATAACKIIPSVYHAYRPSVRSSPSVFHTHSWPLLRHFSYTTAVRLFHRHQFALYNGRPHRRRFTKESCFSPF